MPGSPFEPEDAAAFQPARSQYGALDDHAANHRPTSTASPPNVPHLPRTPSTSALGQQQATHNHNNLVAVCLLVIAGLCLGIILYTLRSILIPFAVALLLYYLLQPIVNNLNKPPIVCCREVNCDAEKNFTKRISNLLRHRHGSRQAADEAAPEDRHHLNQHRYRHDHSNASRGRGSSLRNDSHPPSQHDHKPGLRPDDPVLLRLRLPRFLAILLAIMIAFGVLSVFGLIVYRSVIAIQDDWPTYEKGADQAARSINTWLQKIHVSANDDLVPFLLDKLRAAIPTILADIQFAVANGMLSLIFLVYLLASRPRPMPPGVWSKIDTHVRRYIRLKTFVCVVVGGLVGLMLYALSVPFAGLFGLITFLFNFIPNFGPFVATLLPMPLVIFSPLLPLSVKLMAFILPTIAHLFVGNYVEPRIFGDNFELHPIIILLSLAFWSVLWGVPGMILSVPLMAIARIAFQHLDHPYARVGVRVLEGKIMEFDYEKEVERYEGKRASRHDLQQQQQQQQQQQHTAALLNRMPEYV